jgi:autotransporter-associated beta strand protein
MKNNRFSHLAQAGIAVLAVSLAGLSGANGATRDWTGASSSSWTIAGNWVDGIPVDDLTTDIARFNQASYPNQPSAPNLRSINGLAFGNDSTATAAISMVTGRNTNRLNIGDGGIVLNQQSGAVIIGSGASTEGMQLGASQSWTNNSSSLLTVTTVSGQTAGQNYVLTFDGSGSGGIIITGAFYDDYFQENTGSLSLVVNTSASTLTSLNGANTYSGTTTVTSGILNFTRTSAKSNNTAVTVAASGSIGLGVGSSGFFNAAAVDQLFSNTLAGVNMNAASGVAIDTTNAAAGNFTYATNQSAARSLTKLGANTLTLTGSNTYSGATIVNAGTLLVNGSVAGSGVTVNNGGTLGGNGTVSSLVTVKDGGTLSPGNSPGIAIYSGGLTLETGSNFTFELIGNTTDGRGTNFDGVNVTGGTFTLQSGVNFNIILNGAGSTTDFTNAFWSTDQSWLVFANTNAPSISSLFTVGTVSNDFFGNPFSSTGGSFDFFQSGNDIYLQYVAIPEPSTWLLVACSLTVLITLRKRRNV